MGDMATPSKVAPFGAIYVHESLRETLHVKLVEEFTHSSLCQKTEDRFSCEALTQLQQNLDRILQDGLIHPLEAPKFYKLMLAAADENYTLTDDGVEAVVPLIVDYAKTMMAQLNENREEEKIALFLAITSMFAADGDAISNVGLFLEKRRLQLENFIAEAEMRRDRLRDEESSYAHFVNAENVLGLSVFLTPDGKTFSSLEVEGLERMLQRLYEFRAGFHIFQHDWKQGKLALDNPFAATFLASPFAQRAELESYFTDADEARQRQAVSSDISSASEMVRISMEEGATQFAIDLVHDAAVTFGEEYETSFTRYLPGKISCWLHSSFTTFANTVASLDSLALLAVGGITGKLIARSALLTSSLSSAQNFLGFYRYFLPGIMLFTSEGGSLLAGGLKLTGNVAIEFAKLCFYTEIVRAVAGDDAAEIASRAYLFAGSTLGSFEGALRSVPHSVAPKAEPMSPKPEDLIISQVKKWKLERAARHAARRQAETIQLAHQLVEFAQKHPGIVDPRLLNEAEQLAGQSTVEALTRSREIVAQAREKLTQLLDPPRVPVTPKIKTKKPKLDPAQPKTKRTKQLDKPERKGPPKAKALTQPLSPLDECIAKPPAEVSAELVTHLSKGKICFAKSASNELVEFYQNAPRNRTAFWRRISELVKNKRNGAWRPLRGIKNVFRGRIADYRIIVKELSDEDYEVISIVRRGDTGWKER